MKTNFTYGPNTKNSEELVFNIELTFDMNWALDLAAFIQGHFKPKRMGSQGLLTNNDKRLIEHEDINKP